MKRNNLYYTLTAGVALMALLGFSSCHQFEMEETETTQEALSRADKEKIIWTFDTTEVGAGKLDSLLTAKGNRDIITDLYLSGPINTTDLRTIANMQYLDSLSLDEIIMTDSNGNPTEKFGSFSDIKSKMGISLPKSITTLEYRAFRYGQFDVITIPDNIKTIEAQAFRDCSNLQRIVLPDNLTDIQDWDVFAECNNLTYAKLPANLSHIPQSMFAGCDALTEVEISPRTTSIGTSAFYGCSALSDNILHDNITVIGKSAFAYCTSLGNLTLPANLTEIGTEAFAYCSNLVPQLPASLKTIGQDAFLHCSSITTIDIPKGVESIGSGAFAGTGITTLTVPADIPLADKMFTECKKLTSITFSDGIETIPSGFLQNCTNLESVTFSESITNIGERVFSGCTLLANITLPTNLQKIDRWAFSNCTALKEITLPRNLNSLGAWAFECSGIENLEIPASLTSCGSYVVDKCEQLSFVLWNATGFTVPDLTTTDWNTLIYLPEGVDSKDNVNIIMGNHADQIQLSDNGVFHCPRAFTADKIYYIRDFSNNSFGGDWYAPQTGIGKAARWQSLSLPFTPTSIMAKEGESYTKSLAPFDAVTEGQYPFWLRELTTEGFKDVAAIEKNKAYIISMPYNDNYLPEYNINTKVRFMAENITVEVTPKLTPSVGATYSLNPNYISIKKRADYLTLNKSKVTINSVEYLAGGVFNSDRNITPFEAYVTSNSGSTRSFIPLGSDAATRSSKKTVGKIPQKDDM